MARFPLAEWHGTIPNRTPGGMGKIVGVVLHIMQGSLNGTDSFFHNPNARASSHFGTGKDGRLFQWVDTTDKAWAQVAGNTNWLSIENEGFAGEALTPQQVERCAQIYAWAVRTYGVPLQITNSPSVPGLGWHGMGSILWGGHSGCPGDPIKNQRPAILARARQILNPEVPLPPGSNHFEPPIVLEPIVSSWIPPEGGLLQLAASGAVYAWPPAVYRGSPNGKPYFVGRTADHLERSAVAGCTYCVVDGVGERYDY